MADAVSLEQINAYLADHSFLGGERVATLVDYEHCARIGAFDAERMPHLLRWHAHISHLMPKYAHRHNCCGAPIPAGALPVFERTTLGPQSAQATAAKPPTQKATQAVQPVARSTIVGPSHFCVLDFEKTCQNRDIDPDFGPQEIIEFPSVLLAQGVAEPVAEFESFVHPRVHPKLTPFCTELTGIMQQQVDSAEHLPDVLAKHHAWLRGIVPREEDCIFVTCGDMDLKRSLPEDPNVPQEIPACYRRWVNIKKEFGAFYTQWYKKKGKQPRNMEEMLEKLEITLDGQHHSGIDDSRNIAKVLQKMLEQGWTSKA